METGKPGEIPVIRTRNDGIWIRFLPERFRYMQAFHMGCDGGSWLFTRPAASSMMDTLEYEDLRARNPHLDLAISAIASSFEWVEWLRGNSGRTDHRTEANSGFSDRLQQERVTGLFCDLMAWSARNGPSAMANGGQFLTRDAFKPGLVGFDKPLQARLDAGGFLRR